MATIESETLTTPTVAEVTAAVETAIAALRSNMVHPSSGLIGWATNAAGELVGGNDYPDLETVAAALVDPLDAEQLGRLARVAYAVWEGSWRENAAIMGDLRNQVAGFVRRARLAVPGVALDDEYSANYGVTYIDVYCGGRKVKAISRAPGYSDWAWSGPHNFGRDMEPERAAELLVADYQAAGLLGN